MYFLSINLLLARQRLLLHIMYFLQSVPEKNDPRESSQFVMIKAIDSKILDSIAKTCRIHSIIFVIKTFFSNGNNNGFSSNVFFRQFEVFGSTDTKVTYFDFSTFFGRFGELSERPMIARVCSSVGLSFV